MGKHVPGKNCMPLFFSIDESVGFQVFIWKSCYNYRTQEEEKKGCEKQNSGNDRSTINCKYFKVYDNNKISTLSWSIL